MSEDIEVEVNVSTIPVFHRASYNFMSASSSSHPTLSTNFGNCFRLSIAAPSLLTSTSYSRAASSIDKVPARIKTNKLNCNKVFIYI